ncbi:MAG TPA: hypothetical protein VIG82_01605 [Enteractinococcus sp.]
MTSATASKDLIQMHKLVAKILGIIVAALAIVGFFIEGTHLFGLMNVDIALDITRTVVALVLLYVGFGRVSDSAARLVVAIVGGMYIVMGLVTFIDPTHFGILPTGFTGFDVGFHLIVGAAAVVIGFLPNRTPERTSRLNPRAA